MIGTSAAFRAAVRSSHQIATQSVLLTTPGTEGIITASMGTSLSVISGSVTLDSTADVRGTLDMTVLGTWPRTTGVNQILPYGSEISIARGLRYGNGSQELVQLGIFRIDTVEETERGVLQITAFDRMKRIQEAQLLRPVQFDQTFTFGTAVATLIHAVLSSATITWDDTAMRDTALPRQIAEPQNRLGVLQQIVAAAGKYIYFDNQGRVAVKTPPQPGATPTVTINAGRGGILVSTDRRVSRDGVFNCVVASSQAIDSNAPVQGNAVDLNPASPTYFFGPYGQVPMYFSSPLLTTVAQCNSAAQGLLYQNLGLPYSVDLTSVPDPSYEPLDTIKVVFPVDLAINTDGAVETHVLSSVQIPLGVDGGVLQAHTRLQSTFMTGTGF